MKTTYLYIKETPEGLKYLGKTEQNPLEYEGSGVYWKKHLKKHNYTSKDITTTILLETTDKEELKSKGIYYSDLYDVVNSEEWANLKPEIGDGGSGPMKEEVKSKIRSTVKKRDLSYLRSDEVSEKRNRSLKGRQMPPCKEETKKILSDMFTGVNRDFRTEESYKKGEETKRKNGTLNPSQETKDKIRQTLSGRSRPKEVVDKLGKKVSVDGVVYSSMSEAERVLSKSRYQIKKQHKVVVL